MQGGLAVAIEAGNPTAWVHEPLVQVGAQVEISSDQLVQSRRFELEVDQSYLSAIIKRCSQIVQQYPIGGQQDREGL